MKTENYIKRTEFIEAEYHRQHRLEGTLGKRLVQFLALDVASLYLVAQDRQV